MMKEVLLKLLYHLPKSWVTWISKRVVHRLLNKYASIRVEGAEYLDAVRKPTLFICNHLSNSDGLVLNRVLKDIRPTFVAGVKLSGNSLTRVGLEVVKTTHIIPDSPDKEGITKIIQLVKNGESLLIFPEGTRSRTGRMIEGKKGILMIARLTGATITPIGITGTDILLPINKDGDMGAEKFQKAEVTVRIGPSFELPTREKSQEKDAYEAYAMDYVMHQIADLLPESYRGVYGQGGIL